MEIFLRINFDHTGHTDGDGSDIKVDTKMNRVRYNRNMSFRGTGMKVSEPVNFRNALIEPHFQNIMKELSHIAVVLMSEDLHARVSGKQEEEGYTDDKANAG